VSYGFSESGSRQLSIVIGLEWVLKFLHSVNLGGQRSRCVKGSLRLMIIPTEQTLIIAIPQVTGVIEI
jgi:hypothetical protein